MSDEKEPIDEVEPTNENGPTGQEEPANELPDFIAKHYLRGTTGFAIVTAACEMGAKLRGEKFSRERFEACLARMKEKHPQHFKRAPDRYPLRSDDLTEDKPPAEGGDPPDNKPLSESGPTTEFETPSDGGRSSEGGQTPETDPSE